MPQLDTIYIFMTYLWTWLTLHLITQKIKTYLITNNPVICLTPNKPSTTRLWT